MALAALFAVALAGCTGSKSLGRLVQDAQELLPATKPGESAVISLGGTKIPVTVRSEVKGSSVEFEFLAHNQTLEVERYESTRESFSLVEAAKAVYDPTLPLLKFPMNLGDKWDWKGKLISGTVSWNGEAEVTTRKDSLVVNSVALEAVRVDVQLRLESGGPTPAARALTFWFVPQRGILKREFGHASTRTWVETPVEEE